MNNTFVICEASKNWLTSESMTIYKALENAKKLASIAKSSGGNCVKYQCHVAEDEVKKRHAKRHSWITLNEALTPFDTFWKPLKEYCDEIGIEFLCTPMSKLAAEKINPLIKRWKVASPDIRDWELLQYLKDTGKPIIFSTGMATEDEVWETREFLGGNYKTLACVSEYPCPIERADLEELRKRHGLSDHTQSLITGALAVALGAEIVEKHFSWNGWGKDAHMSLNPEQLKEYIENIREAEKAMLPVERPTEKEKELLKEFYIL